MAFIGGEDKSYIIPYGKNIAEYLNDDEIDIEDKISRIMKNLGSSARTMLKNRLENDSADDEDDDDEDVIEVPVEENAEKRVSDTVSSDTS